MAKKYRFQLLIGQHRIGAKRDREGNVLEPGRNLQPGDKFESDVNLVKHFPSDPPKFRRIDPVEEVEEAIEEELEDLSKLTVKQLRERAEAEEVDISGLHTKAEILEALVSARAE